jgi:GH25 family lysozyme M1 (1,4-beta-N-acetylmuramidase)
VGCGGAGPAAVLARILDQGGTTRDRGHRAVCECLSAKELMMTLQHRSIIAKYPRGLAIAAVLSSAGLFACAATDDGAPSDDSDITHPEDDTVGSQVRLHEGTDAPVFEAAVAQTPGMDVSSHQGNVNWSAAWANGARFAYVKATEGTTYQNPNFAQQYNGSLNVGMIRGAYHFALPDRSSGATQGAFFVSHGGGWSNDGKTLPPAIDLEYNPYGASCYGLSQSAMVAWIRDIAATVKARTGRDATFYTSTSWWSLCTGNNASFGANPLWIPRYASSVGALPASWTFQTIWQNADSGIFPGDQNKFNGAIDRLQAFAR